VLAVAIWLLSPETIRISATARQYELLGLFAILVAWQTARLLDGRTDRWNFAAFGALALGAMLTQYLAAFVILTAVGLVALERRELLPRIVIVLAIASMLFCVIHPGFYMQIGRYETAAGFADRLIEATSTLLGFYGWRKSWTGPGVAWTLGVALSISIMLAALYWTRLPRFRVPVAFAALPTAVTLAAYLASLTPSYAFSERHVSFAWPFVALLHAIVIDCISRRAGVALLVLLAVVVGPAEFWIARGKPQQKPDPVVAAAPQIVVNNTATGVLPRYMRSAAPGAAVYAADDLTVDPSWLADLKAGAIVIVNPQYLPPATVAKTERLLQEHLTPVSVATQEKTAVDASDCQPLNSSVLSPSRRRLSTTPLPLTMLRKDIALSSDLTRPIQTPVHDGPSATVPSPPLCSRYPCTPSHTTAGIGLLLASPTSTLTAVFDALSLPATSVMKAEML
jgi:hypothetical protein